MASLKYVKDHNAYMICMFAEPNSKLHTKMCHTFYNILLYVFIKPITYEGLKDSLTVSTIWSFYSQQVTKLERINNRTIRQASSDFTPNYLINDAFQVLMLHLQKASSGTAADQPQTVFFCLNIHKAYNAMNKHTHCR